MKIGFGALARADDRLVFVDARAGVAYPDDLERTWFAARRRHRKIVIQSQRLDKRQLAANDDALEVGNTVYERAAQPCSSGSSRGCGIRSIPGVPVMPCGKPAQIRSCNRIGQSLNITDIECASAITTVEGSHECSAKVRLLVRCAAEPEHRIGSTTDRSQRPYTRPHCQL